jgi:metal-responsive CopG/Arc/MetJ family transcriptional regulator
MEEYKSIKIPIELVDKMDYVIRNRLCGYRSRAEIASEGIRIILSGVVNNQHQLKEADNP